MGGRLASAAVLAGAASLTLAVGGGESAAEGVALAAATATMVSTASSGETTGKRVVAGDADGQDGGLVDEPRVELLVTQACLGSVKG